MKSVYEIKRFKSSRSTDLTKALKLYSENIEPYYRTDTNEIIYWIDHFEKRFGDDFIILGFYLNDTLIGYAQMAFFKEERFVEIDYLVIDKAYRKNNAFFEFVDKIGYFLQESNIVFDYLICEVGCYFEDMVPTESSKTLIRLLKMSHFGVIKCAYYVPKLGKTNYESQMRAILMIYSNDELKQLRKDTYMMIINTLLFKYYKRWYADFFTTEENYEYELSLQKLFDTIKKDVDSRKNIEINGYQNLLPLNPADFAVNKTKKLVRIISFIVLFVTSLLLFGTIAIIIKKKYDIDVSNQSSLLVLCILVTSIVISAIFGSKSNLASKIIEKLIDRI